MTDKQPDALRLAVLLELAPEDGVEPQTTEDAAAELRRLHADNEALASKLKAYEDLDEAASDVQLLRMGYAAARLEIQSLQARINTMAEEHADELMVAHLDGRMRAAQAIPGVQWQCGPQANGFTAPQTESQPVPVPRWDEMIRQQFPDMPPKGWSDTLIRRYMTRELDAYRAARAPADSALEDAARLDWLESNSQINIERVRYLGATKSIYEVTPYDSISYDGETLRAAIDAARAAQEGKQ